MMCRHLLPRLDLPFGQTLHGLGRLAVAHPTSAAALVLLPLCAMVLLVTYRDVGKPAVERWRGLRPGSAGRLPSFIGVRLGPAHSG